MNECLYLPLCPIRLQFRPPGVLFLSVTLCTFYCTFTHTAAPLILRSLRYFYKLLTHRIYSVLRKPVYLRRLIQYHYFMWKISLHDPVPLRAQAVVWEGCVETVCDPTGSDEWQGEIKWGRCVILLSVVWLALCQFLSIIQCNRIATFHCNSTHACVQVPNAEEPLSYFNFFFRRLFPVF